jgi:hypothetical protein
MSASSSVLIYVRREQIVSISDVPLVIHHLEMGALPLIFLNTTTAPTTHYRRPYPPGSL